MKKHIISLSVILVSILVFSGCSSTTKGISTSSHNNNYNKKNEQTSNKTASNEKSIEVMQISTKMAFELAKEVIENIYPEDEVLPNPITSEIVFRHNSYWAGDVQAKINLNLVYSKKNEDLSGVIYDIKTTGVGANFSLTPGYVANDFFKELKKLIKEKNIKVIQISSYKITKDRSISKTISASIPSSYIGFKNYIEQKNRKKFEGIWESDDGLYTFGIISNPKDRKYKYNAFIINSKHANWKEGQIKVNFTKLRENKFSVGKWFLQNKTEVGVTCEAESELIRCMSRTAQMDMNLIKVYPTNDSVSDMASGVGTGWAISEDGIFVTNAHVVNGADKIYVGFKENNPSKAKVLMIDNRLDLAILKINSETKYKPIPINSNKINNGSDITVVGYPLAFTLGDDPRVTSGIVSAQSGINKDITRYQISATIQPGNSGGPIFNNKGEAIGIVVEKLSDTSMQAVNFGIKSSYLLSMLQQLEIEPTKNSNKNKLTVEDTFKKYRKSILPIWTSN